ncbi:type I restriction enzyme S subunit [Parabacteroides sp. PFB2-12]|uniref:restriction endonuclease subunit S n=1 Tax=unclassified Parabacteroides TaxID=2649774 RepID=UPI002473D394|nr:MULTISPECIES: restriction endonuclease subunit S [unclassified Parabacteroides]MDH6343323.1 type I restriction enzyme S subunit [Parabacteroides sp. PM6-13]MDH6390339.1 type I restriction enzyme S subunit [Parabacteroides sp. PFB2-12]
MVETKFKQTEIGVIPEDWEVKKLGEVGEVKMCRRIFSSQTSIIGDIPFFKIGTFGDKADAYISNALYENYKSKFSFPKKGDILISAAGTIGRTIIYDGKDAYFQDSNIVWIDNNEIILSNKYLYYVLQIVKYNTEGGTIQRLYNSILNNTKFPLPPLPEQRAIAEVLSDTDAWIESLEKLIAKKRLIKQGAMQELLTPKEGWEVKKLGEVVLSILGGGTPSRAIGEYWGGNIPWMTVKDFATYNRDKTQEYITQSGLNNSASRIVKKGDLIIATRIALGQIVKYNVDVAINQDLKAIRLSDLVHTDFFIYFYRSISTKIIEKGSGSTVLGLSIDDLKSIPTPLPPFPEQLRIATILSDMDAEIEALENKLAKARQIKQGMMQELLTGRIRFV